MAQLIRVGDLSQGHYVGPNYFPPTPATSGSPNVFINGKPLVRVGDTYATHCSSPGNCHPVTVSQGLSDVLVNGKQAAYVGCLLSCGDHALAGSPNVSGA